MEPGPGIGPLLPGSVHGDAQNSGHFVVAEACELMECNDLSGQLVFVGEPGEGFVECEESLVSISCRKVGKFDPLESATVLLAAFFSSRIDQNASHRFGRGREEMPAAIELLVADQPEVRLMDEGRGLNRLIRGFVRHPCGRELSQLVVDERKQFGGRLAVAGRSSVEKSGRIGHDESLLDFQVLVNLPSQGGGDWS